MGDDVADIPVVRGEKRTDRISEWCQLEQI